MDEHWEIQRVRTAASVASDGELSRAVAEVEAKTGTSIGTYFLIDPTQRIDPRLSKIFAATKFRRLAETTQTNYTEDVRAFFDFLWARSKGWADADLEDVEDWEYWRTLDPANPRHVRGQTWDRAHAAIKKVYLLAEKDQHSNLGSLMKPQDSHYGNRDRGESAKWLLRSNFEQWRDVGLRGFDWEGNEDPTAQGRMSDRNSAFVSLLVGTGLRSAEAHLLTRLEIPPQSARKTWTPVNLPGLLAKGGSNSRVFYVESSVLSSLQTYQLLARARAVSRGNSTGAYERMEGKLLVTHISPHRDPLLTILHPSGQQVSKKLSMCTRDERPRLYEERANGELEPLALWLSSTGTPLALRSWQSVFAAANLRNSTLAPTRYDSVYCHPHMLRHTFAMGMLMAMHRVLDRRFDLTAAERRDYELLYGNAYDVVRDLLGHSSKEVTKAVYLPAIRDLDVLSMLCEIGGAATLPDFGGALGPAQDEIAVELLAKFHG